MAGPGIPNRWIVTAASGATRTFVCPAGQRGIVLTIHGSSATGGVATLNLGAIGGVKQLGAIPGGGRMDIALPVGVFVGDRSTNIVLNVPADFNGHFAGYAEATTS